MRVLFPVARRVTADIALLEDSVLQAVSWLGRPPVLWLVTGLSVLHTWRNGARRASALHAVGMLLLGLLAAGLGLALGAAL